MKKNMPKKTSDLNRYKILSAYTKAVLKHPLFEQVANSEGVYETHKKVPLRIRNPNEYFVFIMIESFMNDYHVAVKQHTPDSDVQALISYRFFYPKYLYNLNLRSENGECIKTIGGFDLAFIKLLHHHGKKEQIDNFPLFSFARIFSMLEMSSDCAVYGLSDKYYENITLNS